MTINYATLPFGLRRPPITFIDTRSYGVSNKTGDWASSGMAYYNIYWNFGQYLNDWSSGELPDEFMQDLLDNPQHWGFCGYCSEGPKGDLDGFILLKDWSDPDAHPRFDPTSDYHKNHLEEIANVPTPSKDYVISENQMAIWWPFYHLTGPAGLAEKAYIDLENQVHSGRLPWFLDEGESYPFSSRMWWYFETGHDAKGITYEFDRERFIEDFKKRLAKANKLDPTRPLTPSANQMAVIDSFSKYDSVLDIANKQLITPALGKITPVMNYRVVSNPDKTAKCILPMCQSKTKRGDTWENTCHHPLMIQ